MNSDSDIVTVRFEGDARKRITAFAQQKMETKSDIIRKATLEYIQREDERNEIKEMVAKKFAEQKISFDEMVRILGYDEAKKVAFFIDIAEKSLREGI
jgi:metal-responsive CopG/Arc/MetJ family transcriptional regulator